MDVIPRTNLSVAGLTFAIHLLLHTLDQLTEQYDRQVVEKLKNH